MDTHTSTGEFGCLPNCNNDNCCLSFEVLERFESTDSESTDLLTASTSTMIDSDSSGDQSRIFEDSNGQSESISSMKVLDELTAPYSNISDDECQAGQVTRLNVDHAKEQFGSGNIIGEDPDALFVEDCIEISRKCLQHVKEEQSVLREMLLSVTDLKKSKTSTTDCVTDAPSATPTSSEIGEEDPSKALLFKNQRTKQISIPSSIGQDRRSYLGGFENSLSAMYPRIVGAVLIGFIVSFLLFLAYTMVFESYKMQQIQSYENMTKEERQEKNKYRTETDNFRDALMHKSYEEARQSSDILNECQNSKENLKGQVNTLENKIFRLNIESREVQRESEIKIEALRKVVEDLTIQNKKLEEKYINLENSRSSYDYLNILGGFVVGLLAVIFFVKTIK